MLLMTCFYGYKIASRDKIALNVTKVENMARQLRDIGETLSDVTIIAKILGSLPEKYNALITAWDSVENENQMLDRLWQRLIKDETRMNAADEASDALAMSLKTSKTRQKTREKKPEHSKKDSAKCFYCYKLGHYMKNCRMKKRDED